MKEKYEYMIKVWGGFFGDDLVEKHGYQDGYYYFNSIQERENFKNKLQKLADEYKSTFAYSFYEGCVRYKTITSMNLIYNGKPYHYTYDFGFGYPEQSAYFMWHDGNYSCDCNKSLFLNSKYGDEIEKIDCGDTIEISDFTISKVRVPEPKYINGCVTEIYPVFVKL